MSKTAANAMRQNVKTSLLLRVVKRGAKLQLQVDDVLLTIKYQYIVRLCTVGLL